MKIAILILLLTFSIGYKGFSQKPDTKEIQIKYTFNTAGETKKLNFICLIPNDIENIQKVKALNYSITPKKVFTINENKYAEFTFENLSQNIELTIDVTIDLFNRDYISSIKESNHQSFTLDSFLIDEKYIEISDSIIINQAQKLKHNDTLKTVKKIYNFVHENIKFCGFVAKDVGAAKTLKWCQGDCTDFSDLFVALCRANGIPARVIEGYTTEFDDTPLHSWPEVYLNDYGWIRFDPTANNAISFSHISNKYIQLSNVRNDSILKDYHRWTYTFRGDSVVVKEEIKIICN
jgi:transglutaminase/protease-like cytokinesis protein 3